MAKVIIHATVTLDGFMADTAGGLDWMFDFATADEDGTVVNRVLEEIGAVVGGANKAQTVEDGELPYGGMLKVPVYLMTHSAHEPVVRDGVTYTFVVDDIKQAVEAATQAAGDKAVSLLGGCRGCRWWIARTLNRPVGLSATVERRCSSAGSFLGSGASSPCPPAPTG